MSKKNLIFCTILLFAFISACYLSVSPLKTSVEVDDEQDDISISILSTPKSSGYDVTERWNYSSNAFVQKVAVSADGKYMAATTYGPVRGGNPSHQIFFFNTSDHDGIPLWSFASMPYPDSLAISGDGEYIIAGSSDGKAWLLNSTVPEPGEDKLPVWYVEWGGPIYSVDISADGKLIVMGVSFEADVIFLYNNSYASEGYDKTEEYEWYCDPTNPVLSVAISADGKYVAAGTEVGEVRDVGDEDELFFLNTTDYTPGEFQMPMWSVGVEVTIDSLAISADGEYIAAGSTDGFGFLLNKTVPDPWTSEKYEVWYVDWGDPIHSVDISASGSAIVLGLEEEGAGVVVLLDNKKPTLDPYDKSDEYSWYYETAGIVTSVSITWDGRYIVAGTEYGVSRAGDPLHTVFLFYNSGTSGDENEPEWSFDTENDVNSVSISAYGNHFAAGGDYTSGRTYLFYHARPPPLPLGLPRPDDDDDDDEEAIIPFGNYYLVFAAIAVVALIIIYKRKTVLSKK